MKQYKAKSKFVQFINPSIDYIEKAKKSTIYVIKLYFSSLLCIAIDSAFNKPIYSKLIIVFIPFLIVGVISFYIGVIKHSKKITEKKNYAQGEIFMCQFLYRSIYYNIYIMWILLILFIYIRFSVHKSILYISILNGINLMWLYSIILSLIIGYIISIIIYYVKKMINKNINKKIYLNPKQVIDMFTNMIYKEFTKALYFIFIMVLSFILNLNVISKSGEKIVNDFFDLSVIIFVLSICYAISNLLKLKKMINIENNIIKGGAEAFGIIQMIIHLASMMIMFSFISIFLIDSNKFSLLILIPILLKIIFASISQTKIKFGKLIK